MAYYLRLFTKSHVQPSLDELRNVVVKETGAVPILTLAFGGEGRWYQTIVRTEGGRDICLIERSARGDADGLFEEDIEEFKALLAESQPSRGAQWVAQYLDDAVATYALRYLEAGFEDEVRPSPTGVLWAIKGLLGGIVQADGESFTNEAGYSVVWNFSDSATGHWNFAVLEDDGRWRNVGFDLGDKRQRLAFQQGTI